MPLAHKMSWNMIQRLVKFYGGRQNYRFVSYNFGYWQRNRKIKQQKKKLIGQYLFIFQLLWLGCWCGRHGCERGLA